VKYTRTVLVNLALVFYSVAVFGAAIYLACSPEEREVCTIILTKLLKWRNFWALVTALSILSAPISLVSALFSLLPYERTGKGLLA